MNYIWKNNILIEQPRLEGALVKDWVLPKQDAEVLLRSLTLAVHRAEESDYLLKRKQKKA